MESKIHMKFEDQIEESFMIDRPVGIFGTNESFYLVEIAAIQKNVMVFFKRNDVNSQMCLLQFWDWSKIKEKIQNKLLELSEISRDESLEDYFEPIFAEITPREMSIPIFDFKRNITQPISMMGSIILSVDRESLIKRSFWS